MGTISQTVKVKIFWYFEILKIRTEKSHFELRRKPVKNQNNNSCDEDHYEKKEDQNRRKSRVSRDRSELQRLCRYYRCKAVHNNGEE